MKLNKFLLSAIAAASLTACSDSPEIVDNNKGHWNADGTGYMSLSISMPDNVGSKGSRANNDIFEKGDDNEYAVKNATLVIFSGDTDDEASMKIEAAYDLPLSFTTEGGDGNQIISKGKLTKQINKITKTYAKALVILNMPSNLHLDGNSLTYDVTTATGTTTETFNGTFTDFQALQSKLNVDVDDTKGFTMTNAPLTKGQSGTTVPTTGETTTLATINKDNIKPTAEEASNHPAAEIYVERSVAKVTVNNSTGTTPTITTNTNIKYSIDGYVLDNTNTTSYIVRNADETATKWYNLKSKSASVSGSDQYRFIGTSPVYGSYYRTYWAKDPNYTNPAGETGQAKVGLETNTTYDTFTSIDKASYCRENTFDVENQTQENTTRAILRVQMWTGEDGNKGHTYYMYNDDATTFTDNLASAANNIVNNLAGVPSGTTVQEVELEDPVKGKAKIKYIKINSNATEVSTGNIFESLKNYFGDITVYTNGYAYYPVLIKHFGDQLTPWNIEGTGKEWSTTQPSTNNIYPGTDEERNNNYLGRYGVVRNNWYELKINSVKRPGKSTINTPKDTPDDNLESYISVSINILSWAKRSQDVDLQ
uniref:Mfa1 family fimbria major subunit n=1 Tax=Alloprevotella sp. TaxID=1872471 RepID=UPI0040292C7C